MILVFIILLRVHKAVNRMLVSVVCEVSCLLKLLQKFIKLFNLVSVAAGKSWEEDQKQRVSPSAEERIEL